MKTKKLDIIDKLIFQKVMFEHVIYNCEQTIATIKIHLSEVNNLLGSDTAKAQLKPDVIKSYSVGVKNSLMTIWLDKLNPLNRTFKKIINHLSSL